MFKSDTVVNPYLLAVLEWPFSGVQSYAETFWSLEAELIPPTLALSTSVFLSLTHSLPTLSNSAIKSIQYVKLLAPK